MRVLPLLALLVACDRLKATEAIVNGATTPVVVQGMFLGLDVPDGVDLSESDELAYASLCEIFLANVTDPANIGQSPVEGAGVSFVSPDSGSLRFGDDGEGKYSLDSEDGLVYTSGEQVVVNVGVNGERVGSMSVRAPAAPEVELPSVQTRNKALTVRVEGYENLVVAAYDVDHARMAWDNLPSGVEEAYDFTHPPEPVEQVEIPAEAFRRPATYVVGVAGMAIADPDDFEGVNTSLSAFIAGQLTLRPVVVAPD